MHRATRILAAGFAALVVAAPAAAQIVGNLEAPSLVASQASNVQGWAYTKTPGAELVQPFQVLINGEPVFDVPCCSARGDVQAARPDAPLRTGFSGVWNWGLVAVDLGLAVAELSRSEGVSINVSVVVSDTAGGVEVFSKDVVVHAFSDDVPFFRRAEWVWPVGVDGDKKRGWCDVVNFGEFDDGTAGLWCHNLILTRGEDIKACDLVNYSWERGSQGFKQTSDCLEPPRWVLGGYGTVIDSWTGLEWQTKLGVPGATVRCDDDAPVADPLCDDPFHVNNIYNWGGSPGSADAAPSGSVFTRFLAQLNNSVAGEGTSTDGCFSHNCDWRIPTVEELSTLHDSGVPDCGEPPAPFVPCTTIPGSTASGFYWTRTTNDEDVTEAVLATMSLRTGYRMIASKGASGYVRAVRGATFPTYVPVPP